MSNSETQLITLKTRPQFQKVLTKGEKNVKKSFLMFHLENSSAYYGIIVSRKQFKKAVDRNRAKRRLRAALRYHLNKYGKTLPGHNVFIIRHRMLDINFKQLVKEIS